jgi:HEAT repeat protein
LAFSLVISLRAETTEEIMQQIERLRDPSREVRQQAFGTLWKFGKSAVPTLLTALENERLNEQDETTRMRVIQGIVYALGKIGDKSAVPPLLKLVLEDKDGNVNIDATEALCLMGDEKIVFDLMKLAMQERNNEEHMMAPVSIASGLANMGEAVIPTLMKGLEHEDWEVRFFAIGVLNQLVMSYPEYKDNMTQSFKNRLNDENPEVSALAKKCLGELSEE